MGRRGTEIMEELKGVLGGKTLDALVPSVVFVVTNGIWGLNTASVLAIATGVAIGFLRILRKQAVIYAFGGLVGVGIAAAFAYLAGSAVNFFIPKILSSAFMVVLALGSLAVGKPLAAWASHLTRGWPITWFWRKDVKPAYREVTWFWAGLFLLRTAIQVLLFMREEVVQLAWANVLLGTPFTIVVLVVSYVYGIWRLHKLGGPGVEEYAAGKQPPWKGQTRGF